MVISKNLRRHWIHLIRASRLHFTAHHAVSGFDVKDQYMTLKTKERTVRLAQFLSLDLKDKPEVFPNLYGYLPKIYAPETLRKNTHQHA